MGTIVLTTSFITITITFYVTRLIYADKSEKLHIFEKLHKSEELHNSEKLHNLENFHKSHELNKSHDCYQSADNKEAYQPKFQIPPIIINMSTFKNCHFDAADQHVAGNQVNVTVNSVDDLKELGLDRLLGSMLQQQAADTEPDGHPALQQSENKAVNDPELARRVVEAIAKLMEDKVLVNLCDMVYIMHLCNDCHYLPSFTSPQHFINYLKTNGLARVPSLSLLQKANHSLILDSHYPNWRFTDEVTDNDALRIQKIAGAFIKMTE